MRSLDFNYSKERQVDERNRLFFTDRHGLTACLVSRIFDGSRRWSRHRSLTLAGIQSRYPLRNWSVPGFSNCYFVRVRRLCSGKVFQYSQKNKQMLLTIINGWAESKSGVQCANPIG